MPEENFFVRLEETLTDEVNQSRCGTASVHRVKQDSFMAGKLQDGFFFRGCQDAVTGSTLVIIYKNFFRLEFCLKLY